MSIADDPFFQEFPQAARDRIEAAEILRDSIVANSDAQAREIVEVFHREMDPLGINQMIYGDSLAVLTARQLRAPSLEKANRILFKAATEELWKRLKPNVEAFLAKAPEAWRLVYGSKIPEQVMRDLRERVLLLRVAFLESASFLAAQLSPNKAAAARSRSESADELRRKVREMKRQGYTQRENV